MKNFYIKNRIKNQNVASSGVVAVAPLGERAAAAGELAHRCSHRERVAAVAELAQRRVITFLLGARRRQGALPLPAPPPTLRKGDCDEERDEGGRGGNETEKKNGEEGLDEDGWTGEDNDVVVDPTHMNRLCAFTDPERWN